ncbi:MAG: DNA topoisomerase IV [Crocinitomicaceae bacterium]|nr:DNA topoisomerase IV [Crocinitomicaceae bacterium]|tara:strand:+ start:7793 stop:10438 length:2646 start_codon:yes stop_codon:yes gene_type:complete
MSEDINPNEEEERDEELEQDAAEAEQLENVIQVSGMYEDWFLDYASYVILERAVPHINDGLKPVQRRILHSMRELEDGRYNKVANVVGNTMKYHPHGDASISDAMVQIGQKDLLIDTQGNWGNVFTGDGAAASRYIEARLTKFALEVVFNPKTTDWQLSYDGRNNEPITLPVKFPLLLAQGVEGIAVGMACKVLPHNFIELIDCSIKYLQGKRFTLLPDFQTAGMADFSNYNDGLRGGKVRVRAKVEIDDKKMLRITEIPFGTTTSSLIDSILKANDKGKIKIKKVEDNTAEDVEILVHLPTGISPDKMVDALYAFTDCEVSISPNTAVIQDDKPIFLGVTEILKGNTDQTVELLKKELEIELNELETKWHFSSLEKIFIENKIYVEFDGKTYDEAKAVTYELLQPHIKHLIRDVTDEDIEKLMEIRMRRITKHDAEKADTYIQSLEDEIERVKDHLANLIEFAIDYYKNLKKKYGAGKERKTEIKSFENIEATKVAVKNAKLYANYSEGFVGHSLKRGEGEFIVDCSDIDDVICIREDGKLIVTRIDDKTFVGKNLRYVGIWKKGDKRTTYNLIYQDGVSGPVRIKRFHVNAITRDREYDLTKGAPKSKILYLSVNPNGEAEVITVLHRNTGKVRKLKFDYDFAELDIKGRAAGGNILTKYPVNKITLKEEGVSTLAARKIWFDPTVERLNSEGRGEFLGEFKGDDKILQITQTGEYKLTGFDLSTKFEADTILFEKWKPNKPISAIYFDGEKDQYTVKRFLVEDSDKKVSFLNEDPKTQLELVTSDWLPVINISFDKRSNDRENERIELADFISIKGLQAKGNRLTQYKVKNIDLLESLPYEDPEEEKPKEVELPSRERKSEGGNLHDDEDDNQITLEL